MCLLFTCFPLLLSKEYKTIFPDLLLLKDFEGHYEYFMVFAKIFRNTAGTQKKKIQEEIVKYKSYESVSSSEKLLDIIEMFLDSE